MHAAVAESAEAIAVVDAVEGVADELVRIALRYDVSSRDLEMAVRRRFIARLVEEADERQAVPSVSSLAIRAGISQFCVNAALESDRRRRAQGNEVARMMDQMASLLNEWHTDPRFSGPFGLPAALRLSPERGDPGVPAFSALVEHAAPGSSVYAVLSVLRETRSVQVDEDEGLVRCTTREFIPLNKDLPQIQRYGRCIQALARTLRLNMTEFPKGEGYFERTLVTDQKLTVAQRDQFHSRVWETGQFWLGDLDSQLGGARVADDIDDDSMRHYGVGVFFFELPDKLGMVLEESDDPRGKSGVQEIDLVQGG